MAELRPFVPVPTPGRFKDGMRFSDDAFAPISDQEVDPSGVSPTPPTAARGAVT